MEIRTPTFEDVHEVAVRLAAQKLTPAQYRNANREARTVARSTRQRGRVGAQLYRIAFFNEAAAAVGDHCFGLNLGRKTDTRNLGIIHYVFASSANALDAIRHLVRYHHMVNSMTVLDLEETDREVTLEAKFRPGLESFGKHIAEWGPTTFVAALRDLTGTRIAPRSVSFRHRRTSGLRNFKAFFGCAVRFGANRQSITFATNALLAPIRTADPYLLRIMKSVCEEALGRRRTISTPVRAEVEEVLLELLPHGEARVEAAAEALSMSLRSLARRLAEEGTSYAAVIDDLRHDLAMRYLEDKTLTLNQVAWLLGYSKVTSFNHAFQRWTSSSPTAVRARLTGRKAIGRGLHKSVSW
jgi:AraC-like DNA-binding protein